MSGHGQVDHVLRPVLAVLFVDQRQLPQVMRIAQVVEAFIFPVGRPAIMDGDLPWNLGRMPKASKASWPWRVCMPNPGQGLCRGRMQPVEILATRIPVSSKWAMWPSRTASTMRGQ